MADPLSIASACLAAVETIATVAFTIRKFVKECRAAKSDLENVQETLSKLQTVFTRIKDRVSGQNGHLLDANMRDGILSGVNDCVGVIQRIHQVVADHVGQSSSKWVRNGKKEVASLESSLETCRSILQLAVSGAELSLLISVKADTAALRRDVQQLLANRTRQRRLSIESTCETVITLAAERLVLADSSTSKTPISAVESDSENAASSKEFNGDSDNDSMIAEPDSSIIPRPLKENPENNPKEILGKNPEKTSGKTPKVATKKTHKEIPEKATKNISCKRVRRVKWYTDAHKTQCVTITPEGDIVAMSSMKEVMAWDLSEFDDDAMRPPLLFDEGLRSWHVPAKLVLERDEMNGLILAVSSSRSVYGGFGGGGKAAVESKLLVHSYETDKTLYSEVLPRRFIGMGLSFPNDVNATMEVILPSSKRAHMVGLLRGGEGDKMTSMESQAKLDTNDIELDEYSSGLSMSGEHLLASAKRPDKYGALVVFMFNTCSGEQVGKTKLPDGFALVTGIPVGSYGREAILVLWADDTKATGLFRWEVNTGRLSGEVVHRFEYARNAWQRYAVSPDGQFVAVCLSKQEVEIVDVRTGEQVVLLCPKHDLPRDVGTSRVGLELTKGNCRGNLMAWSVTRRRLVVATRKGAEVWDISGAP